MATIENSYLTPAEQRLILDRVCPKGLHGTYNNTVRSQELKWTTIGTFSGAAIGGGLLQLPGVIGGSILGYGLGYMYGNATGHTEGRALQAAGVKQADESCVAETQKTFEKGPKKYTSDRIFW